MDKYILSRNVQDNSMAPCGMNCATCIAYLRVAKPCPGCRSVNNGSKPKHCDSCVIKNCEYLAQTKSGFCFDCPKFPCIRMKNLDKRYRRNYGISLLENLNYIKQKGISAFIENEQNRWKCQSCGSVLCVHRGHCLHCNAAIMDKSS